MRIRVLSSLFLACLLWAACRAERGELVVSGRVELDDIHVGSKIGGRIEQVLHQEGDGVKAGEPILVLDGREVKAQLEQARAAEGQAQAQLDLLLAGTRREEIERAQAMVATQQAQLTLREKGFRSEEIRQAEAQLAAARSELELARREYERARKLVDEGTISQSEFDAKRTAWRNAQAQVNLAEQRARLYQSGSRPEEIEAARAQLAQSKADLERLKNGARPEEIAAARSEVESAKANVSRLQTQLEEMRIVAPLDATVETLDLRPGDLIRANETVAVLLLRREPYVRCYLPENRLGWVRPGMDVTVTVDSFPKEHFKGKVRRVAQEAEFTPRNVQTTEKRAEQVFEMKVDVTEGGERLRPGMYADVHVPKPR